MIYLCKQFGQISGQTERLRMSALIWIQPFDILIVFLKDFLSQMLEGYSFGVVRQLCYLLNHWTKSNQIWFVSYSHGWGVQQHIFFGPPPPEALGGGGQKVKYHLISITKSISKILIPNFVCVLTNVIFESPRLCF